MFSIASRLFTLNRSLIHITQSGYKSSISLDKLYPKSDFNLLAKPNLNLDSNESFSGYIPIGICV